LGALLSSKEVMEKTGISRATLNNYIALGILPKPEIGIPDRTTGRAPRIGYFPSSVLDTLKNVEKLKTKGYTMAQVVDKIKSKSSVTGSDKHIVKPAVFGAKSNGLELTVDHINYPGYLLNYKFQMEWCNDLAEKKIFGQALPLSNHIEERNIFQLLFDSQKVSDTDGFEDILRFHLSLAKGKLSNSTILMSDLKVEPENMAQLIHLQDEVDPAEIKPLVCMEVNLSAQGKASKPAQIFASFFREGIFIIYLPVDDEKDSLLTILGRRDLVIRDLLRKRRPYLTHMSVLVADLQSSYKICAELPPEEYFELINSVWNTMESLLRKYYATGGKHVGDGVVYYFFPQPEENHVLNTIRCAQEMKDKMLKINREWCNRKSWSNELMLNIGIDQGEEWFGTYQTATQLEFTVLGETVNRAGRLSDFAKHGSIWTTKNALATLTEKERENIHFGIRRGTDHGPVLTPSSYSQISNLIDIGGQGHEKMMDISGLPVTEIFDVAMPETE